VFYDISTITTNSVILTAYTRSSVYCLALIAVLQCAVKVPLMATFASNKTYVINFVPRYLCLQN